MDGRVLQVSVSPGGVPKLPVDRAWVGPLGLDGDGHNDDTVHGGPHRAVALFAIEAIERVQSDGHPIEPGSAGENLTTTGIELALLPVGTRLAIGERLVLEISGPDNPCDTIAGSFRDGKSGRISILRHPTDSRMYARTLVEGELRPGDTIRLLPPAADSQAVAHAFLDRNDAAVRGYNVDSWQAAVDGGLDVRFVDDGELALVAAPGIAGRQFNRALGYRKLPNLLPRMEAFFREHGTAGWIEAETSPWPDAPAEGRHRIMAADIDEVEAIELPAGLTVRDVDAANADAFSQVLIDGSDAVAPDQAAAWRAIGRGLVGKPGHRRFLAELDGRPVATAGLYLRRQIGLLATMTVLPEARGRGIQRALIAHRARIAAERGATHVVAAANDDSISTRNLMAAGLKPVWERAFYRFDPAVGS